eukprot:m.167854 g.167854  ORF g.167854 m.167854 type:complete len:502 (-) comp17203_c1_seq2:78-1583(-)
MTFCTGAGTVRSFSCDLNLSMSVCLSSFVMPSSRLMMLSCSCSRCWRRRLETFSSTSVRILCCNLACSSSCFNSSSDLLRRSLMSVSSRMACSEALSAVVNVAPRSARCEGFSSIFMLISRIWLTASRYSGLNLMISRMERIISPTVAVMTGSVRTYSLSCKFSTVTARTSELGATPVATMRRWPVTRRRRALSATTSACSTICTNVPTLWMSASVSTPSFSSPFLRKAPRYGWLVWMRCLMRRMSALSRTSTGLKNLGKTGERSTGSTVTTGKVSGTVLRDRPRPSLRSTGRLLLPLSNALVSTKVSVPSSSPPSGLALSSFGASDPAAPVAPAAPAPAASELLRGACCERLNLPLRGEAASDAAGFAAELSALLLLSSLVLSLPLLSFLLFFFFSSSSLSSSRALNSALVVANPRCDTCCCCCCKIVLFLLRAVRSACWTARREACSEDTPRAGCVTASTAGRTTDCRASPTTSSTCWSGRPARCMVATQLGERCEARR